MLPIYKYITNEEYEGMDFIALVDNPAHMKGWSAFNNQKPFEFKQYFNEDKRIIMGVAIATEVPIYRNDKELGEHYAVFTKDETDKIWERMMASNFMHNVNEMHEENRKVNDIFLKHSYAIDYSKGIVPPTEFESQNLKDGSIIAFYKVNSDEAWKKVKSGEFKGFSIEGYFDRQELKIKNTNMKKEEKPSLMDELKAVFSKHDKPKVEFAEATTVDGVTVFWEGELAKGIELKIKGEDGTELLAPEGAHAIANEDGTVQVITVDGNGIIVSIETEEAEAPEEEMDADFDLDAIKGLLQDLFAKQAEARTEELKAFKAEIDSDNKKMFEFVKSNLDKDDKKKFVSSDAKNWKDLITKK